MRLQNNDGELSHKLREVRVNSFNPGIEDSELSCTNNLHADGHNIPRQTGAGNAVDQTGVLI